jgi:hypothetical protein
MSRILTDASRAGMRRGGETTKRLRVGIFAPTADHSAAGRLGAFASHARNRAEKRGLFDPNSEARVIGGQRGGRRCAEKIALVPPVSRANPHGWPSAGRNRCPFPKRRDSRSLNAQVVWILAQVRFGNLEDLRKLADRK